MDTKERCRPYSLDWPRSQKRNDELLKSRSSVTGHRLGLILCLFDFGQDTYLRELVHPELRVEFSMEGQRAHAPQILRANSDQPGTDARHPSQVVRLEVVAAVEERRVSRRSIRHVRVMAGCWTIRAWCLVLRAFVMYKVPGFRTASSQMRSQISGGRSKSRKRGSRISWGCLKTYSNSSERSWKVFCIVQTDEQACRNGYIRR